jgi:hypothetical protein
VVAALYIDPKGPYPALGVDCWDETRDARLYPGPGPVVAHPACGPWGRLRWKCGPALLAQEELGPIAMAQVRRWGGVLEHPKHSRLWKTYHLPLPGDPPDAWGGVTLEVEQYLWGHRAVKPTWIYAVRCASIPPIPTPTGPRPPSGGRAATQRDRSARSMLERLPKTQRHLTPPAFATWLVALASSATQKPRK